MNKITTPIPAGEQIEINDQDFLHKLIDVGFRPGRNNMPQDLQRILKNVPPQFHKDFIAGFNAK